MLDLVIRNGTVATASDVTSAVAVGAPGFAGGVEWDMVSPWYDGHRGSRATTM